MTQHRDWFSMISRKTTVRALDGHVFASVRPTSALFIGLFIAVLLLPIYFNIGETRLSMSRVFLLISFIPLLMCLLTGRAGRLMAADYLMMAYCGWVAITYTYHYGTGRIALSGITIIEQLGAYLLGRVLVRNATDYRIFIQTFFIALLVLLPFALFELFTGRNLWAALFDLIFSVHQKPGSAYGRLGLERVMSGFEHPILYGLFCSLGVANFFYVFQPRIFKAVIMMVFTAGMTFMSLSSAPLMAVVSQALMITWDKATKGRWVLLAVLAVFTYVTIDALSNRTPVTMLISTLTFNPVSAWTRVAIWDYGYAAVMANPIMGIGLEDWPRPFWVTSSVDNFWLLISMRHGIPAIVLLLGALACHLVAILRTNSPPSSLARYRTGYVLALLCLYFTLCTVHIWGGVSSFTFFYIGAGLWLAGTADRVLESVPDPDASNQRISYGGMATSSARVTAVRPDRPAALPQSRFPNAHKRGHRED